MLGGSREKKHKSNRKCKKSLKNTKLDTTIHNLSNHELSYFEKKVLEKGLNFVVANKNSKFINKNLEYIDKLHRNMQLKLYFEMHNKRYTDYSRNPNIGKPKIPYMIIPSTWNPPDTCPEIEEFCIKLKQGIKSINNTYKNKPNLSKNEFKALINLRNNKEIVIKAADKGGGVVVLNTSDYVTKMNEHLSNATAYLKLEPKNYDPNVILKEYLDLIFELKKYLSKKQYNWLIEAPNEVGIMYGLPKIHKKNHPIRPIASQIKCLTNRLHIYLQQLLKIGELQIPNIIKDTTDFINKLKTYENNLSENTYLVALDVEALYTNIPLEWGISALVEHYSETLKYWCCFDIDIKPIPPGLLAKTLEFTLKNCYFSFNNDIYKQLQGLTMGGASSVQAANIIMFKFFQKFHTDIASINPNLNIWHHFRFIDDLFGIWNNSMMELKLYFNTLNNYHKNFKFTMNYSLTELPFLDVKVTKIRIKDSNKYKLGTKLYTKPTDRKLYLDFKSEHALHIKRAIPFSQMLRLKRIVSDINELNFEIDQMTQNFRNRNYPINILLEAKNRLSLIDRSELLTYKTKRETKEKLILVQIFENKIATNNRIKKLLRKHWLKFTNTYPYFKNLWPNPPIIAFKNSRSIRDYLISSKHPPPWHDTTTKNYEKFTALDELNLEHLLALIN